MKKIMIATAIEKTINGRRGSKIREKDGLGDKSGNSKSNRTDRGDEDLKIRRC